MELIQLRRQELKEYVDTPQYLAEEFVPISKHRARSQICNPRAKENDVLLILCKESNQLCGYLGVLPDDIFYNQDGEKASMHFGWLSCIWVHPQWQGRGIARKLLEEAIHSWGGKLLGTEFIPGLDRFYRSSGIFNYDFSLEGVRIYFGSTLSDWVPRKLPLFRKITPLLKIADHLLNGLWDSLRQKAESTRYRVDLVNELNEEHRRFLEKVIRKSLFERSVPEFNWILQHPWVLEKSFPEACEPRYHFTSCAEKFSINACVMHDEQHEMKAIAILLRRDKFLSIPYLFVKDEEAAEELNRFINAYVFANNIRVLKLFQKRNRKLFQGKMMGSVLTRRTSRGFICSDVLSKITSGQEEQICDGDGDCAFT